jgi:hypothetical protein
MKCFECGAAESRQAEIIHDKVNNRWICPRCRQDEKQKEEEQKRRDEWLFTIAMISSMS